MVTPPRPAPWSQLGPTAWLVAQAFTSHRILAILAAPLVTVALIPFAARRVLYRSADGNGTVVVGPYRPVIDTMLLFPVSAAIAWGWLAAAGALLQLGAGGVLLIIGLLVVAPVAVVLSMSRTLPRSPVGKETPPGSRWLVANLAQKPGTEMSAVLLTRALIRTVPRGSVLVATAASEPRADDYQRLGFTRGRGRRVYRVL